MQGSPPERKCYFSRVPLPRTNERRRQRRRRLVISRENAQELEFGLRSGAKRAAWKPVNLTVAMTLARSLPVSTLAHRKRHKRP